MSLKRMLLVSVVLFADLAVAETVTLALPANTSLSFQAPRRAS